MKTMQLAAKITIIIISVILFFIVKILAQTDFTSSEDIITDVYNNQISFYSKSNALLNDKKVTLDLDVNGEKYEDVKVSEVIPTDSYIGVDRLYIYCLNISNVEKGSNATLFIRYSSIIEYMLLNRNN